MNAFVNSQSGLAGLTRLQRLELFDEYYSNNFLYEKLRVSKYYAGVWNADNRPLRTPVNRSVGFYMSKIAVGEPVVSADKNQALADAVTQILDWSNFQILKPTQIKDMAKYGDLFRRAVVENGKTWHEVVDTKVVSDFHEDSRGFLTFIRMDVPVQQETVPMTHTEVWTVEDNLPYMAVWTHRQDENTPIEKLGDPDFFFPLSVFGIDFVPFVRTPFTRNGINEWGSSCFEHAVLKVDEVNRQATRLHQMLFRYNKPLWVYSSNMVDEDGRPIPARQFDEATDAKKTNAEIRDDTILYLEGLEELESLVPDIQYDQALHILESQEKELEKDLPELKYYSLADSGSEASGKALKQLLSAAMDRAKHAENNYKEGTVRLGQMCLTMGQFQGIFPTTLGSFDDGSLAHSLRFDDPFPTDISEKATVLQTLAATLGQENMLLAMEMVGFSEEERSKWVKPKPVTVNTVSSGADNQTPPQ